MTAETWVILTWLFVVSLATVVVFIGYVALAQRVTALEAIRRKPRKAKGVPTV